MPDVKFLSGPTFKTVYNSKSWNTKQNVKIWCFLKYNWVFHSSQSTQTLLSSSLIGKHPPDPMFIYKAVKIALYKNLDGIEDDRKSWYQMKHEHIHRRNEGGFSRMLTPFSLTSIYRILITYYARSFCLMTTTCVLVKESEF